MDQGNLCQHRQIVVCIENESNTTLKLRAETWIQVDETEDKWRTWHHGNIEAYSVGFQHP